MRRGGAIVASAALSLVVGGGLALLQLGTPPVWLMLCVMGLLCALLCILSLARERDALSPILLVALVFFVLYVLRPLYVLSSGRIGPTRALDQVAVTPEVERSMSHALGLASLSLAAIAAAYFLPQVLRPLEPAMRPALLKRVRNTRSRLNKGQTALVISACFALAAFAYWSLIRQAGGLSAYVTDLSVRSGFFFGRAYLTEVTLPFKIAVFALATILLTRPALARRVAMGLAVLTGLALVGDFLTGGRAAIVLGTLLPLLVLIHYGRSPLRLKALLPLLLAVLAVFVGTRAVTRDAVYAHESRVTAVAHAFEHLPSSTVGGVEAVPFDSLVTLVQARDMGSLPLQAGRTYEPVLTFPIPRAVWPNKPVGGGNAWFTSTFFPVFYGPDHIETSLSFVGESYANFGAAGVLLGSILLGLAISLAYRGLVLRGRSRGLLMYALSLGSVFQLIRGDAFHALTTLGLVWFTAALVMPLVFGARQRTVDAPFGTGADIATA